MLFDAVKLCKADVVPPSGPLKMGVACGPIATTVVASTVVGKFAGKAVSSPSGLVANSNFPLPFVRVTLPTRTPPTEPPYFDPLRRRKAVCHIRALRQRELNYAGLRVDALVLEVRTPAGEFTVTTGPDGEVFSVAGPGGIELRRATALQVRVLRRKLSHDRRDP